MILVLHGENTKDLYARLQGFKKSQKEEASFFGKEQTFDDFYMAVNSVSLIEEKNFFILENFFKEKKLKPKDKILEGFPQHKTLVIYETAQLTPAVVRQLSSMATVENFKAEPLIFWFLDSIGPSYKQAIEKLAALPEAETGSLVWNLANRFLLMLLCRMNYSASQAGNVSGRTLAPWQWQKIADQSRYFSEDTLKKLYSGMLKIDYMNKTGQTALPPKTLVSYLLLKYLKV